MKLINRISSYYLINSTLLFLAAFITVYFALNWTINEELDEQLLIGQTEIIGKLQQGIRVNNPPFIEVTETPHKISEQIVLSDTSIYLEIEEEYEPFRQAISYFSMDGNNYRLTVRASLVERKDLLISLLIIFAMAYLLMVAILYIINRQTAIIIFQPFYRNLDKLKNYSIKSGKGLNLQTSDIDEFADLNAALHDLSAKAGKEYRALREFTENISHELQTPVSVVKSKLELLLQKEISDEEMIDHIHKAYHNINKLDKLNRSLVLLSKLESKDFFEKNEIHLEAIAEKVMENYAEIAGAKNISIFTRIKSGGKIQANETLLDILLSNLISNAIKHNYNGGKIEIELENTLLNIGNTGSRKALNGNTIFERFNNANKSDDSLGLGLAIVGKICKLFNYEIQYSYQNGMHLFELKFE